MFGKYLNKIFDCLKYRIKGIHRKVIKLKYVILWKLTIKYYISVKIVINII